MITNTGIKAKVKKRLRFFDIKKITLDSGKVVKLQQARTTDLIKALDEIASIDHIIHTMGLALIMSEDEINALDTIELEVKKLELEGNQTV